MLYSLYNSIPIYGVECLFNIYESVEFTILSLYDMNVEEVEENCVTPDMELATHEPHTLATSLTAMGLRSAFSVWHGVLQVIHFLLYVKSGS